MSSFNIDLEKKLNFKKRSNYSLATHKAAKGLLLVLNAAKQNQTTDVKLTARHLYERYNKSVSMLCAKLLGTIDSDAIRMLEATFGDDGLFIDEFVAMFQEYVEFRQLTFETNNREANTIEITEAIVELFDSIDLDGDRNLTFQELLETILLFGMKKEQSMTFEALRDYQKTRTHKIGSGLRHTERIIEFEPSIDRILLHENGSNAVHEMHPETLQIMHTRLLGVSYISALLFIPEKNLIVVCTNAFLASYAYVVNAPTSTSMPLIERILTKEGGTALYWELQDDLLYYGTRSGNIRTWRLQKADAYRIADSEAPPIAERIVRSFNGHTQAITSLCSITGARMLCSSSLDCTVRLWDMDTLIIRHVYSAHKHGVISAAFSAEFHMVISASIDQTLCCWNPFSDDLMFQIKAHSDPIISLHLMEGTPQIITADSSGIVKIWDARSFICSQIIVGGKTLANITPCSLRHERIVLTSTGVMMTCLDAIGSRYNPEIQTSAELMTTCVFNNRDFTFAGSFKNSMMVWSALTGILQRTMKELTLSDITAIEFDDGKRKMIVGENSGALSIVDYATGKLMRNLKPHKSEVSMLQWCGSNMEKGETRLLSVSLDGEMRLQNEMNGNILFEESSSVMTSCACTPTGSTIGFGDVNGDIQMWRTSSGMCSGRVSTQRVIDRSPITAICFCAALNVIVCTDEKDFARIYHLSSSTFVPAFVARLANAPSTLMCLAFHESSMHLFAGDVSGNFMRYDLAAIEKNVSEKCIASDDAVINSSFCFGIVSNSITKIAVIEQPETIVLSWFGSYTLLLSPNGDILGKLAVGCIGSKWLFTADIDSHQNQRRMRALKVIEDAKKNNRTQILDVGVLLPSSETNSGLKRTNSKAETIKKDSELGVKNIAETRRENKDEIELLSDLAKKTESTMELLLGSMYRRKQNRDRLKSHR